MSRIRVAEVFSALSLTTDLASGVPFEKGLRTCVVATAFGGALGLAQADRSALFHASLLRAIGCTAYAPENAGFFVDDTAFQGVLKRLDPGDPATFGAQLATFGRWVPGRQADLARLFVEIASTEGPRAGRAGCEVSRALGGRVGLPAAAVDALDDVYERWDGLGLPDGRRGDELSLVGRAVHVAEQAVFAHAEGGRAAACAEVARRAGGHLDPDLAAAVLRDGDALLAVIDVPDMLAAVVAAEPGPVVDLKGRHLLGHFAHVAAGPTRGRAPPGSRRRIGGAACGGAAARPGPGRRLQRRVGPAGPLGAADWERVRLHGYWTDRILRRCPGLAPLAELAAAHHERCDGSGYHRGVRASELPFTARLW